MQTSYILNISNTVKVNFWNCPFESKGSTLNALEIVLIVLHFEVTQGQSWVIFFKNSWLQISFKTI
jgi:hypothetical protein